MARRNYSANTPQQRPKKYQQARRRRTVARQRRRFEAVLPNLSANPLALPALHWPALPLRSLGRIWGSGWHASKLLSSLLLLSASALLFWLHLDLRWYIYADSVRFTNLTYLSSDDLYPRTALEGWNVLWIEPQTVSERLLAHPYVAAADVHVRLPNRVTIDIREAQPIALWVTGEETLWLLDDGSALEMQQRSDRLSQSMQPATEESRLPKIVDILQEARALNVKGVPAIDRDVLHSALSLLAVMPELGEVRYNQSVGLNFSLPGTPYWVYWGDGRHVEEKLENLAASRLLLSRGEITGQVVDVRFLSRPTVR